MDTLLLALRPYHSSGHHQLPAVRTCTSLPEGFLRSHTKEAALSVIMESQQSQEITYKTSTQLHPKFSNKDIWSGRTNIPAPLPFG